MATFKALSRGTQLVLVAGPLLFLSLFFTWQHVEVDYGSAGVATSSLDGFDAWGLILALLSGTTVVVVALRTLTEVEFSDDIPWDNVTLGAGLATAVVAVVKSVLDAESSWASYGFVALALAVGVGTWLDWSATRREHEIPEKRRGFRPVA